MTSGTKGSDPRSSRLSPSRRRILPAAPARAGVPAARSRASERSAAMTGSFSIRVTRKPAAARSMASSPSPAVASTAVGFSPSRILAAFTRSSELRLGCRSRFSIRVKSPCRESSPFFRESPLSSTTRQSCSCGTSARYGAPIFRASALAFSPYRSSPAATAGISPVTSIRPLLPGKFSSALSV